MFTLAVIRMVVFVCIWICLGRRIWLLPNLFSDEAPINELLRPLIAEDKQLLKDGSEVAPPSLPNRIAAAVATIAAVVFLYRVAPDGEGLAQGAKGANQGLLEMLNLQDPRLRIAGGNASDLVRAQLLPRLRSRAELPPALDCVACVRRC